jgi:hypothetical protein
MPQLALARHVFVCMQGEHVVFLDVRRDRYFALESSRTAGLADVVPGWPVPATVAIERSQQTAVVALLLDKGILTPAVENGKVAAPIQAEPPRSDLTADTLDETPRVGAGELLRFVSAAIRAALLLKYRSFESVIHRVGVRAARTGATALDASRTHRLVAVFATLRPFFFTAKDACLFDALALSEFLASYRIYPRWIFGVQARPFAAHCWLQLGSTVLNDTVEHVRRYTPIMVV